MVAPHTLDHRLNHSATEDGSHKVFEGFKDYAWWLAKVWSRRPARVDENLSRVVHVV